MFSRRNLFGLLAGAVAAPLIVPRASLMGMPRAPLIVPPLSTMEVGIYNGVIIREYVRTSLFWPYIMEPDEAANDT